MPCTPSSSPFTSLVQPTASVSATPAASSFDPGTAYLLGQCCALTYAQFDAGAITLDSFSAMQLAGSLDGHALKASNLVEFTVSEASEPGPTPGDVGDYFQTQGGFGVQLAMTQGQSTHTWTVIALRGTRTFTEWLDDAEALPVAFAPGIVELDGQGSVHSGFYADYTVGTSGAVVASSSALSGTVADRAPGSLAAQVGAYLTGLNDTGSVYVTGHSLGAALATLCAMDIALNFPPSESLALYALASPRVAVGLSDSWGVPLPTLGNQAMFVRNFQNTVPNAYQVVNAADIVPISPPLSLSLGALTVTCMQVTDPYEGSGAAGTASVADGAVTGVSVSLLDMGSGYAESSPPPVSFSGGAGWGAAATASVDFAGLVSGIEVTSGGFGYTSAPTVSIGQSGTGLCGNVVTFCVQTGDIGMNHGCLNTYLPYLQALAGGFS